MGFDNECILNIQSLPGEYFCPVCRTLIYPNEALQTQCTHLYCKPCLAYVVATTKACPYDGYLVTETDSKPLVELNKPLAETIGRVMVHCLYHKSGCQWQGTLSASITHGSTCAYGNSPVVCNRCGTQIVHRQVQEHAQLCPVLQSQTQQAGGSQAQASTNSVSAMQDPSLVASAGAAAAPAATTLPTTTGTAATASSVATGGPANATTASTVAAPSSFTGASPSAPQTSTADQWYQQQLQYSQYYQQHYPGYNPYMQQYQHYGQYQQAYPLYTQPQPQALPPNVVQASVQPASYVHPQLAQPSQSQLMQSQPQNQPQLQAPTSHLQTQEHAAQPQPQSQSYLPHLQASAGQPQPQQPKQSAPQVPQLQPQSQVALQLPATQTQSTIHQATPAQASNQQFPIPSTQAIPHQVQPHLQAQPVQQNVAPQHVQLQVLPSQSNSQPQMQLNSQAQHQAPQVVQQSYPQSQGYAHPMPHLHSHNPPYPPQQMPHGSALQHPGHVPHQQGLNSQLPGPIRPPLPGQLPAMPLPQGIQHAPAHQQHIGYHPQRPPMHSSLPSQAPQQGLPSHSSVTLQAGQSFQQGMPSQQQLYSQPPQSLRPPSTQPHIPDYGHPGHQVQSSAGRHVSNVAPSQQFQHQVDGPVDNLAATATNQQPLMLRTSDNVRLTSQPLAVGQPTGQGSSTSETNAPKSVKSENASNAADNTAIPENKTGDTESAVMKSVISQSFADENRSREQNDFGSIKKDVHAGVALDSADGSTDKGEITGLAGNSHGPGLQGGKEHKASDASHNHEQGEAGQHASRQNVGTQGAYLPSGMGPQHPSGPDRMLPQNMIHPGHAPYSMQGQPNQMRPSMHSFSEMIRPPVQQPSGSLHSGTTPRAFGENHIQFQTAGIRSGDGTVRPPIGGPPGRYDAMVPPFVAENLGRPHPLGSHGAGGGLNVSARAFHEEGFDTSGDPLGTFAAYPGGHNFNHRYIEDGLKQIPGPTHLDGQGLQRGPRPFEGGLGGPDRLPDSLPGRPTFPNQKVFDHHRADGMPNLRNPGMSGGLGGQRKDQLGTGNLAGNIPHTFDGPEFPHNRFHPGPMHPDDANLVAGYSQHGFPTESGNFSSGGFLRNGNVGWCRICMFNCGSVENLDLHVQTREHQQYAMDIILKMKQDVAKKRKLNYGGPKPFHHKKVAGKGHFRGNRR